MLDSRQITYKGPAFPLRAGGQGYFALSEDVQLVKESIQMILGTRIGSRPMHRDFGSRIQDLVFEPNDEILKALAIRYAYEDILKWNNRILLERNNIQVNASIHQLSLVIPFTLKTIRVPDRETFVLNLKRG